MVMSFVDLQPRINPAKSHTPEKPQKHQKTQAHKQDNSEAQVVHLHKPYCEVRTMA
jgi:hypothetical protein